LDKKAPIGIFDSGIGGLTLASAVHRLLPNEQLVYFGDTAHLPYGDKSTAAIQAYSVKICNVLLSKGVKLILIACNSASSAAYDLVKAYVGSLAIVVNVIDPLVDYVAQNHPNQKVGLIGTKRTVRSNIYKSKIDATQSAIELVSVATPLLAPMIEEGFFKNEISHQIIAKYLDNEELTQLDALILGCTHYPLIKHDIASFYKEEEVEVIDSSEIVADYLKIQLAEKDLLADRLENKHHFFVSDFTNSFQKATEQFFGEKIILERYKLWE
jgi:glutamate racemase